MAKFFNKFKNTVFDSFLAHFPNFGSKKKFLENPALSRITSYRFLAPCQKLDKIMILFQENARKDRQTLIYKDPSYYRRGSNKINIEAQNIVTKLGIENRVERLSKGIAHITVKDQKEVFSEKPSFRLINPSKSKVGKISKIILDKVNKVAIESSKLNQRKNLDIVIE